MADYGTWNYKAGLYNVGSYQVSGYPWITGSLNLSIGGEHRIQFPSVAKSVMIMNNEADAAADLRVHFNSTSSLGNVITGNHFFPLPVARDAITFNIKCKEIYVSNPGSAIGSYSIIAELTGIGKENMPDLTGSGLTD
jgi:hypothetical protein